MSSIGAISITPGFTVFNTTRAFFVTRAKSNLGFRRLYSHPVDKGHWSQVRPDHRPDGLLRPERLSRKTKTYSLPRSGATKAIGISDQQFFTARVDHRQALQMSLAGGAIFQMDQATPPDQSLLWHLRERGQNSGLDLHMCLRLSGHSQKAIVLEAQPLHNSTGFECHSFREKPYFTGPLSKWIRN